MADYPDDDPFTVLGLDPSAGPEDIRAARRLLAKQFHPDLGGDGAWMQVVNAAAREALQIIALSDPRVPDPAPVPAANGGAADPSQPRRAWWVAHESASFVVHCLPVEAFEALLVVATWLGEVIDDDPPYRLDLRLDDPGECLCRLDLVPDAGASTVSISIGALDGAQWPPPSTDEVRDRIIEAIEALGDLPAEG